MHNSLNSFSYYFKANNKIRNRKACHCGIFQRSGLCKCLVDNVTCNKKRAGNDYLCPKFLFVYLAAVLMAAAAAVVAAMVVSAAVVVAMVVIVMIMPAAAFFVIMLVHLAH